MVLSVAAGAGEVVEFPGFNSINYMQEMTQPICYHAEVGETKQLIDSRDNKYYWVTKLKDGNCWMTQNLDFDIPATLYSTTSDVNNTSVTTNTAKVTTPSGWNSTDNTYNAYYDPGDYIYNGLSGNHGQGSYCNTATGLSECTSKYPEEWATTGDTHYHIGNYYSFSAATAKSGDGLTNRGDQATDSICPKGWGLPKSGNATDTSAPYNTDKTFAKLFESYGWKWDKTYYASNLNGGTSYYIYNAPFYFTHGGYLYTSALDSAGNGGSYWSSTVYSGAGAFGLGFYSNVSPANNNNRYFGFSVRCVAE